MALKFFLLLFKWAGHKYAYSSDSNLGGIVSNLVAVMVRLVQAMEMGE